MINGSQAMVNGYNLHDLCDYSLHTDLSDYYNIHLTSIKKSIFWTN